MKFPFYLMTSCLLLNSGCKNEISIQLFGPLPEAGQVAGKIILPVNTKLDTIGLEVLTGAGSVMPVNSSYAIDTTGKTSTTLLMNKAGDVVLMGYNYPGRTESNLSAESTALALLMNTLTLRSLSEAGKLEVIGKIKADPSYKTLVNEISGSLAAGKAVTDTTNTKLVGAMVSLFSNSTNLRVSAISSYSKPVEIKTANTTILLQNSYVAHTYVAGIYKGGNAVGGKYVVGGRTIFATSLSEAAAGVFGDGYGIPSPVLITLEGDGEYELRIRSGKPGTDDGSDESRIARARNVYGFMAKILNEIMPLGKDCGEAFAKGIPRLLTTIIDEKEAALNSAGSSAVFASIALDITGEALTSAEELLESCGGDLDMFTYLKGIGRTFTLIGYATKFMAGANITAHTNDLFQAKASIDTCFQAVGMKLVKCGVQLVYLVDTVSGSNQNGESGKVLKAPLVVKVRTEDGKPAIKARVSWVVKSGGGKVSLEETETSYDGIAQVTWTPGTGKGAQQVEAYVNKTKGSTTATFQATGFDGNDRKAEISSGNSQNGEYGKELSKPLTIRVLNGEGKPEAGVEVTWKILAGGGDFGNLQRITNAQGLVSANWNLGPSGGQNVEVIVMKKDGTPAVGSPVVFSASAKLFVKLIVGKWQYQRDFGMTNGQPWEYVYKDPPFLILYDNGTGISSNSEKIFTYVLDDQSADLIFYHFDGPEQVGKVTYLTEARLVVKSHKGETSTEFKKIP